MDTSDTRKLRETIDLLGLRAQATVAGLVQLSTELVRAGVIDDAALGRIKNSIIGDLMLSRPPAVERREYEASIRRRLDALFAGEASAGPNLPRFGEETE